ncbi:hypothetical protein EMIHUDRAFT_251281 [Emiliania huxleyi CCMP1516]|uniref:Uncharacterized protein n=2 Tax=Emiliania huxleyi TaxID=2903 RepID=A0A0D3KWF4_EMIH1|nr:hypothetical protein EMIHUDRAFT_251281 [Emiliania huxleyi CCMP1516]EOD40089.1 hypothetical protein EMIHUDRAFT_251281 [Emiliania huxleyi CCMP1516]|eukprot:XP_005792518.1 hypothetical protein EMIHUDRAFT_251281 [Emiliania huxleyi CCMP1516]
MCRCLDAVWTLSGRCLDAAAKNGAFEGLAAANRELGELDALTTEQAAAITELRAEIRGLHGRALAYAAGAAFLLLLALAARGAAFACAAVAVVGALELADSAGRARLGRAYLNSVAAACHAVEAAGDAARSAASLAAIGREGIEAGPCASASIHHPHRPVPAPG